MRLGPGDESSQMYVVHKSNQNIWYMVSTELDINI